MPGPEGSVRVTLIIGATGRSLTGPPLTGNTGWGLALGRRGLIGSRYHTGRYPTLKIQPPPPHHVLQVPGAQPQPNELYQFHAPHW
jgi:hypothetical protein